MKSLFEKLQYFCEGESVEPCLKYQDGRRNSCVDEDNIIKTLRPFFSIEEPPPRHLYDCLIWYEGVCYPVQIKSSTCRSADNWSSKKSVLYALTSLSIEEIDAHPNSNKEIEESLLRYGSDDVERDMLIILLEKPTHRLHALTLKELDSLTINGSNLPFQVNWGVQLRNGPQRRSQQEARRFLVGAWMASVKKKLNQHNPEALREIYSR